MGKVRGKAFSSQIPSFPSPHVGASRGGSLAGACARRDEEGRGGARGGFRARPRGRASGVVQQARASRLGPRALRTLRGCAPVVGWRLPGARAQGRPGWAWRSVEGQDVWGGGTGCASAPRARAFARMRISEVRGGGNAGRGLCRKVLGRRTGRPCWSKGRTTCMASGSCGSMGRSRCPPNPPPLRASPQGQNTSMCARVESLATRSRRAGGRKTRVEGGDAWPCLRREGERCVSSCRPASRGVELPAR